VGVIIGMDPHKRSATIEVIDEAGRAVAVGRFGTDKAGYAELLAAGRRHEDRVWAVEGCNGIGEHIAHRLVHDGETVVDVPPKLSAQGPGVRHRQRPQDRPCRRALGGLGCIRAPNLVRGRGR
jgi:transposase